MQARLFLLRSNSRMRSAPTVEISIAGAHDCMEKVRPGRSRVWPGPCRTYEPRDKATKWPCNSIHGEGRTPGATIHIGKGAEVFSVAGVFYRLDYYYCAAIRGCDPLLQLKFQLQERRNARRLSLIYSRTSSAPAMHISPATHITGIVRSFGTSRPDFPC